MSDVGSVSDISLDLRPDPPSRLELLQKSPDNPQGRGSSPSSPHNDTISDTSTESDDQYKQKCLHMQILVKDLMRQLKSQQIRQDGVATISKCLQEERESNIALQSKIAKLEGTIIGLKARCDQSGVSSSLEQTGQEALMPGPSKQVYEELVRENARLKYDMKFMSVDPNRMEQSIVQSKELQQRVRDLEQHIANTQEENAYLNRVMGSSADEKTQEIVRLRRKLGDLEQMKQQQDVLCKSLSDETEALQHRLKQTAEMCRTYALRLQEREQHVQVMSHSDRSVSPLQQAGTSMEKMTLAEPTSSVSTESDLTLRQENENLRAKVLSLDQQLKGVVEINQKWQAHDMERQEEFQRIRARLHETENRLTHSQTNISEAQQEQIDKLILQHKHQKDQVEEEKIKIEDENRRYRMELDRERSMTRDLQNQIQTLNVQVTSLHNELHTKPRAQPSSQDDKERITMLEAQIQLCTEDFESERRDRERAQGKLHDLEAKLADKTEELELTHQQLQRFQRNAMLQMNQRRTAAMNVYQCDTSGPAPQPVPPHLIGRAGVFHADSGPDSDVEVEGEDTVDMPMPNTMSPLAMTQTNRTSPMAQTANRNAGLLDSRDLPRAQNSLQCPKCKRGFPVERHSDLIDHMDICCK